MRRERQRKIFKQKNEALKIAEKYNVGVNRKNTRMNKLSITKIS